MNLVDISFGRICAWYDQLLESKATTRVATTVQDVHEWNWEDCIAISAVYVGRGLRIHPPYGFLVPARSEMWT